MKMECKMILKEGSLQYRALCQTLPNAFEFSETPLSFTITGRKDDQKSVTKAWRSTFRLLLAETVPAIKGSKLTDAYELSS